MKPLPWASHCSSPPFRLPLLDPKLLLRLHYSYAAILKPHMNLVTLINVNRSSPIFQDEGKPMRTSTSSLFAVPLTCDYSSFNRQETEIYFLILLFVRSQSPFARITSSIFHLCFKSTNFLIWILFLTFCSNQRPTKISASHDLLLIWNGNMREHVEFNIS